MSDKIKVVGYAQKTFFGNGIEYRNFSPDLVGQQLASNGGTPLFTMGNFSITTNIEPKTNKSFTTNKFSNFISLTTLDLTLQKTLELLVDNAGVILNLDKSNLNNYALFGSFSEFVRVSLEDIIIKWPASLYVTPILQSGDLSSLTGYTFENYIYDSLTDTATFKINTNVINNKFQLNFLTNGSILDTFNATNDLRNFTVNYNSYVILNNSNVEFPVLEFTAATTVINDYIYLKIKGDAFSGFPANSVTFYHIKPNKLHEEQFFNELPDFEAYLLNRKITPKYTSVFKYPIKSDNGVILYISDSISWPVSDGYNIDFDTTYYVTYATKLLNISNNSDSFSSNLMTRFLVTESISDFDTAPVHLDPLDEDTSGQKMNKTLNIYGRSFDEINNFISGIAFANAVSYDKNNNTPDVYLKNLARVLGWELTSSVLENNLLKNYVTTAPSTYSGQSVGLTAVEADTELWRRIILNTPWLWKSKGARKSIEFLLKFIGAPNGLITFNEYIYLADKPIDVEQFKTVLSLNGLDTDLSIYPIDDYGYPRPLPNTADMYFQNNGLWYRETGGSGSTIDILTGNNPHLGPYDGGYKFINQFRSLIPNFSAVTISSETSTIDAVNLFTNYNLGLMNNYTGSTFVDVVSTDGSDLSDCFVVTSEIINDHKPLIDANDCGCASTEIDYALSVCVDINEKTKTQPVVICDPNINKITDNKADGIYNFKIYQYYKDGAIYLDSVGNPILLSTNYVSKACCSSFGGTPVLYNEIGTEQQLISSGYICCNNTGNCGCTYACNWIIKPYVIYSEIKEEKYLDFITQDGTHSVVSPDGCNCIANYTIPVPDVKDPYTGIIGIGCQLTRLGIIDLDSGINGVMYNTYMLRNDKKLSCKGVYLPPIIIPDPVLTTTTTTLSADIPEEEIITTTTTTTTVTTISTTLSADIPEITTVTTIGTTLSADVPVITDKLTEVTLIATPVDITPITTFTTSFGREPVEKTKKITIFSTPFIVKTGTINCYKGISGAYTNSGVGVNKTIYTPIGQNPSTAPTIYDDSNLSVVTTISLFEYSGILYSCNSGHAIRENIVGSGC